MKFLGCFLLLLVALAFNGCSALPAGNPQDDAEVIATPTRTQVADPDFHDFKGVIDTGAGYPFLQSRPADFGFKLGVFNSFEDILRRLRTRLGAFAPSDSSEDTNTGSSFGSVSDENPFRFGFGLRPLLSSFVPPVLTADDNQKANTTSTVKVVDGHKVEVNETVFGGNNGVFKVRVVNIRPLESGEDVSEGVINNQASTEKQPFAPSTGAPPLQQGNGVFDEFADERREPLEKQPSENEIRDIDEAQV